MDRRPNVPVHGRRASSKKRSDVSPRTAGADGKFCDCRDHHAVQHGTPDDECLPFVGQERWALLTTDPRFRYNELERIALQNYNVQAFEFADNRIGALGMAEALQIALPAMRKARVARTRFIGPRIVQLQGLE